MLSRRLFLKVLSPLGSSVGLNNYSTCAGMRVTVVGGAGGIGQPLSLLLRLNPLVSKLKVYDLKLAKGVAVDLSHCDVPGRTEGIECAKNLILALQCADIVVCPAGLPRKPGQSRDDLFKLNAEVVAQVADAAAKVCPEAFLAIITNPINSVIPTIVEVLKKHNKYDPARVFGITTLDMVRGRKFISDITYDDPKRIKLQVIGGHSAETMIPVISNCEPEFKGDDDEIEKLTKRIKNAGTEVVEAKGGNGSATLSMALAASQFVDSLLKARCGKEGLTEIAYVESCVAETKYFASEFELTKNGIGEFSGIPHLSKYEQTLMCETIPILKADIAKGEEYGKAFEIKK